MSHAKHVSYTVASGMMYMYVRLVQLSYFRAQLNQAISLSEEMHSVTETWGRGN